MPSIYQLKPAFQNLLRPIVQSLARAKITANQVTVLALLLSALTGLAVAIGHQQRQILWIVPVLLLVRMGLNAIDGMLAREHNMKTPLGAILNELGDVCSDATLYLPFGLISGIDGRVVVGVVLLAMLTEIAGIVGMGLGAGRKYDGPMGKSDRAVVFSLISILLAVGILPGSWLNVLWAGVCGLSIWTVLNRIRSILQEVAGHELDASGS
jgi:CDP-diacylglycerol---glycerol-3-phosphate 3-phosphatidyltransferase